MKFIMKTNCLTSLFVIGSILFSTMATFAAVPKAGDKAPLFTGQDQDGKTLKLNSLIGKKIVLLPDQAFFVRVVPLASGTPPEEVPA